MPMTYFPPKLHERAFTCPHCGVMAQQTWHQVSLLVPVPKGIYAPGKLPRKTKYLMQAQCGSCNLITVWLHDQMIFPVTGPGPMPHPDMPEELRADFLEARTISVV